MLNKISMSQCLRNSVSFLLCACLRQVSGLFRPTTFVPLCLCAFLTFCTDDKKPSQIQESIPFSLYSADSVQYNMSDYRGKIVLLHFWADWCPHCRKEFAGLQQASEELKGRGLEILAVNVGQSREHVLELKEEYHLTFPLLLDEKKEITGKYGVTGLPTSFYIDAKGMIREKQIGWLTAEQIRVTFKKVGADN
jgi:peroxiredoxin